MAIRFWVAFSFLYSPKSSQFKILDSWRLLFGLCSCCWFRFAFSLRTFAQEESKRFLLLQHGAKEKSRLTFEIGEEISYKSTKFDFFITDVIVDIQPDLVVLKENVLSSRRHHRH
jgi:hypothetical protein